MRQIISNVGSSFSRAFTLGLVAAAVCSSACSSLDPSTSEKAEPGAGETDGGNGGSPAVGAGPGAAGAGGSVSSAKAKKLVTGRLHSCALTEQGAVRCWGYADNGQLGNGAPVDLTSGDSKSPAPTQVVGLTSGVTNISTYSDHTCAVTAAGGVKCWGADEFGELGTGIANTGNGRHASSTPVDVKGLQSGVASVSAGGDSTCAVMKSGAVKCWGHDEYGKLGNDSQKENGDSQPDFQPPVDVVGLTDVKQVSVGNTHACAVTNAGKIYCWGSNLKGELGLGSDDHSSKAVPTEITSLGSTVSSVTAGFFSTCAVTKSGGAKCWGDGSSGALGDGLDGIMRYVYAPVDVTGLSSGVTAIAAPANFTCAVANGAAKCWGKSAALGLAEGPTFYTFKPAGDVVGLGSGVVGIGTGTDFACALKTDGSIKCWGENGGGQLGDGNGAADGTEKSATPVNVVSFP